MVARSETFRVIAFKIDAIRVLSKILVYISLHEKNAKNAFSKIGFHSRELSDWKVFIVGYMFMES